MKPSTIKLKNPNTRWQVLDDSTGAVLSAIADAGLYHRTLVVVASDNGGSTSDGGNNLPLRGGKRTLFEGGVHVSPLTLFSSPPHSQADFAAATAAACAMTQCTGVSEQ